MILWHATPTDNVLSIREHGLLASRSRSALKAVWLHHTRLREWASFHVSHRHVVALDRVSLCQVRIERDHLNRGPIGGLWRTVLNCDIPPEWIGDIELAIDLAPILRLSM